MKTLEAFSLTIQERHYFEQSLRNLGTKVEPDDSPPRMPVETIATLLPPRLSAALDDLAFFNRPYLLIEGLPAQCTDQELLLLGSFLGRPFSLPQEKAGLITVMRVADSLRETPDHGGLQAAYFTANRFRLHSEYPYLSHPPRFILLWCENNQAQGATLVSPNGEVLADLSQETRRLLRERRFRLPIPDHIACRSRLTPPQALLEGACLRVRFDGLVCRDRAARRAAATLEGLLEKHRRTIVLQKNQCLVINNYHCCHGRQPFDPRRERVIKKLYVAGRSDPPPCLLDEPGLSE